MIGPRFPECLEEGSIGNGRWVGILSWPRSLFMSGADMHGMATSRPSARNQARRGDGQVSRVVGLEAVEEVRREGRLEGEPPSAAARPGSRPRRRGAARPSLEGRTARRRPDQTSPTKAPGARGRLNCRRLRRSASAARSQPVCLPLSRDDARARGPRAPSPRDARSHGPSPDRELTSSPVWPERAQEGATTTSDASGQCTRGREGGEWRPRRTPLRPEDQ